MCQIMQMKRVRPGNMLIMRYRDIRIYLHRKIKIPEGTGIDDLVRGMKSLTSKSSGFRWKQLFIRCYALRRGRSTGSAHTTTATSILVHRRVVFVLVFVAGDPEINTLSLVNYLVDYSS